MNKLESIDTNQSYMQKQKTAVKYPQSFKTSVCNAENCRRLTTTGSIGIEEKKMKEW